MSSVWCGNRYYANDEPINLGNKFFGALHIQEERVHPVTGRDSSPCVTVGSGSWKDKIYHFLPD